MADVIFGVQTAIGALRKGAPVCYLGFGFKDKLKLMHSGFEVFNINELLTRTAHSIKYEFIDYISEIGSEQRRDLRWWASGIASKNNAHSDFFSLVCLLLVAKQLADQQCETFVVTDPRIFYLLRKNLGPREIGASGLKAFLCHLAGELTLFARALLVRAVFPWTRFAYNRSTRRYLTFPGGRANYIYSWVEGRCFDEDGRYTDHYFPGLMDMASEIPIVLFCPYYVKPHLYQNFQHTVNLVGHAQFSTPWKLVRSATTLFRVQSISRFKKFDLSSLWRDEVMKENSTMSYIGNIHDYYCWREFFSESEGTFFYPFENQPWEKMMLLASQPFRSGLKLIGYQHSTMLRLFLPYHTTDNELSYMPSPDIIVVNSEKTRELFHHYYRSTNVKIIDGGALRFANNTRLEPSTGNRKKVIGVMLSSIPGQSLELLSHLNGVQRDNIEFLVKPHPDLPLRPGDLAPPHKTFDGTALELYAQADAIVYCTSTCGMEAFSYGLPVFRYLTLIIDMETGEDLFSPVLIKSLEDIRETDLIPHKPQTMFSPINVEVWKKLLN